MSGRIVRINIFILVYFYLGILCAQALIGYIPSKKSLGDRISIGSSLRKKGEFHQAIASFNEALRIAYDLNDGRSQVECLLQLGILHWNIGQIEQSAAIYRRASSLSHRLGRQDIEAKCDGYLEIYEFYVRGKEECASGSHEQSIGHFRTAIDLAKKMNSPEHELKCLRQMSINYFEIKDHSNFSLINNQALNIAKKLWHKKEVARCLNNLGIHHFEKGRYSHALAFYNDALSILREIDDKEADLSACLNNIGTVFRVLGDYERAVPYIQSALEIDTRIDDVRGIFIELDNLAVAYRHEGIYTNNISDIHISLDYHKRSLQLSRKHGDKRAEIRTLNNIGLTYSVLDKYSLALKYFRLAAKGAELIGYDHETCNIHDNMGYVLLKTGELRDAKESFRKALEIAREINRYDVLWEVYFGLGQCQERIGNIGDALASYRKAIDVVDIMRGKVALDNYRIGLTRDKIKAYEALANLFYLQKCTQQFSKFDGEIFRVIEKAKARSFMAELEEASGRILLSHSLDHRKDHEQLSGKISKTISRLAKPDLDEAERKRLLTRLEGEEEEYTSLLNRIRIQDLERTKQTLPQIVPISSVQEKCLDQRTAIIEYFLGETQSIGILIDKDQLVVHAFPPKVEIENSLKAYLKMLSTLPGGEFMGVRAAQRIYRELAAPFENHISPSVEHLIIIPDGILHYLPFETLIRSCDNSNRPKYLIELFDISYAPSVSSLFHLMQTKRRGNHKKALLAVGDPAYFLGGINKLNGRKIHGGVLREAFLEDGFELFPLPHSRKEIQGIARCFPKEEVDILLDVQAKEEAVKSKPLQEYRIIHFACHGFLDEKVPMRSALVLTQDDDSREDGFLQAREISNLSLAADLVVLSACQTGKGRLENAEGIIGLPRTFFYAGARSMLSTLWKISDKSTAEIMPNFYRYLAEGKNRARALRLAKLEMLESSLSHPFYWGGLVLNGDYGKEANAVPAIPPR